MVAPSALALILPAGMPLATALMIVNQRQVDWLVITPTPNPKEGDQATLIAVAELKQSTVSVVGALAGITVTIIRIFPDRTAHWQSDPVVPKHTDDRRGSDETGTIAPPPTSQLRVVNAALYYADDPPDLVAATSTLALESRYHLRINIGQRHSDSRIATAEALPTPETSEDLPLFISVSSKGQYVVFDAPMQRLSLPPTGDSQSIQLSLTAQQAIDDLPVWINIYYNWTLLQTLELHFKITPVEDDLPAPLLARVSYSRTAGFADLAAIRPKQISCTLTGDGDFYRMSVAWPAEGTNTRREQRGLNVVLPINAASLSNEILQARNTLYDITWQPSYRQGTRGKLAERRESLYQLAVVGNRLYAALFAPSGATAEQAASLAALRTWLETISAEQSLPALQIIHEGMPSGVPWGLLYPEPVNDPNSVDLSKFWGCRYRLEIMTTQLAKNAQQAPSAQQQLQIGGGTYNFRVPIADSVVDVTQQHRAALQAWSDARGNVGLDLREAGDKTSLGPLFSQSDIVYMYCHGHTAKTPDDTSDWLAKFRDQMARLDEGLRSKYSDLLSLSQKEYQPSDPNISDSWLKWNQSLLPLRLLSQWGLKLERKPLVILNMCESAQVLPTLSSGFIPFFSQLGARGILGTECPMLAPFAAAFGQKLIERLGQGEAMGDILPALRRYFIEEERNPLGLAYTYYGDADAKV
ncbi:CHAT domain-containing protein [Herpetosiphon sp. NSE202]|uniref:CHAT domain-containing protein n=1 Tax=Herpetosiphon sp. NSE202 TaxID=3351349 RepID=UPI00363F88CC